MKFKPCCWNYRSVCNKELLHTETFTNRSFYTESLLQRESFTLRSLAQRNFCTQGRFNRCFSARKLLHTHTSLTHRSVYTEQEAFMHRSFHRQTPLHNFTHWCFYIEKLHTDAFSRRRLCTKKLSRRDEFIQSRLCTKQLLHARASRPKGAYRQTLLHRDALQDASLHRSIDRQKGDR